MMITAKEVSEAIGAKLPSGIRPEDEFSAAISRADEIKSGCLFFPHSENKLEGAFEKGAKAVVSTKTVNEGPCFIVEDITKAAFSLSEYIYSKHDKLPAVLITGSEGKTTTTQFINEVLSKKYNPFYARGNYNTIYCLFHVLRNLKKENDYFIFETDESRNSKLISKVLAPRIVCMTNMLNSHISDVGSQEKINDGVAGAAAYLQKDGFAIINLDDPESSKYKFDCNVISIGIENKSATYIAENIKESSKSTKFDIMYDGKKTRIKILHPGIHNIYNAMMAFIVGKKEGISDRKIKKAIKSYRPRGIRQNIIKGKGRILYVDCFNTNATSVAFALRTFSNIPVKKGKRVAVIGDMGHIEGYEEEVYKSMAKAVDSSSIDILITYGEKSSMIEKNLTKDVEYYHVRTSDELRGLLREIDAKDGRNYLFKAGRGLKLEETVKEVFPEFIRKSEERERKRDRIASIKKRYLPFLK